MPAHARDWSSIRVKRTMPPIWQLLDRVQTSTLPVQMWAFCTSRTRPHHLGRLPRAMPSLRPTGPVWGLASTAGLTGEAAALPQVAVAPVTGQLAGKIQRDLHRQDIDAAIVILGAPDAGRGERGGRPLPQHPAAGRVMAAASTVAPRAPSSWAPRTTVSSASNMAAPWPRPRRSARTPTPST
jgi:hypothetical protein